MNSFDQKKTRNSHLRLLFPMPTWYIPRKEQLSHNQQKLRYTQLKSRQNKHTQKAFSTKNNISTLLISNSNLVHTSKGTKFHIINKNQDTPRSNQVKINIPKWIFFISQKKNVPYLRFLFPTPTWYIPQEKAPKAVRKMAKALGPVLGIRRANRTGAKPPGGGPSCNKGMSFTLAIPAFFLIIASVIFVSSTV